MGDRSTIVKIQAALWLLACGCSSGTPDAPLRCDAASDSAGCFPSDATAGADTSGATDTRFDSGAVADGVFIDERQLPDAVPDDGIGAPDVADAPLGDIGALDAADARANDRMAPDVEGDASIDAADASSIPDAPSAQDVSIGDADASDARPTADATLDVRSTTDAADAGDGSVCACVPGASATEACGTNVGTCKMGTRTRTCASNCQWDPWTPCGGPYVGPAPDICNDGIDSNCNGTADEGCSCSAVAAGAGNFFTTTVTIDKLLADPQVCLAYALSSPYLNTPSLISVMDTGMKRQISAFQLPGHAFDFDQSPDGKWLVAALDDLHQIAVIDKATWIVSQLTIPVAPRTVEVTNAGLVYYTNDNNFPSLYRMDLNIGPASHTSVAYLGGGDPDIETNSDGTALYMGERGISSPHLTKRNLSGGTGDSATWGDVQSWTYSPRTTLGASGKHVYFANYSADADKLTFVRGKTGQLIYAEDKAGTFAVGSTAIFDAALVRNIAALPRTIGEAALVLNDQELWTYSGATYPARIYYNNVADYLAGKSLGVRTIPPEPITSYTFAKLVADPTRPRLYGLDVGHELVVAIDTGSLAPVGAIIVGSTPADIELNPSASRLYVGHHDTQGIAEIDLATWTFTRYLPTTRESGDIALLGDTRLVTVKQDQWSEPELIDTSNAVVLQHRNEGFEVALSAIANGTAVFVGESAIDGAQIVRYALSADQLTTVTTSAQYYQVKRGVVATPDGTGVYYAGRFLDGTNLTTVRYMQADPFLTITPNGLLAISASSVYRVSDGALRGTLTTQGAVQAASADSTKLYVATGTSIAVNDLTGL